MLDRLYAHATRLRRRRAERHPERRHRLARPVISVGNLSMGGTGKSPVVAAIAAHLVARGERPSILSRGYARTDAADGVVVVSDGTQILAGVDRAGDEPLMLARQVPGAVVCVSPDRYLAGTLAERALGCTVHILDDGFQHLDLARDLDILVTTVGEIPGGRVIPAGRLREPIDAAARAHVLVVSGATEGAAASEAWTLGISQSCGAERLLGRPARVTAASETEGSSLTLEGSSLTPEGSSLTLEGRVLAVAGIANPDRFADALTAAGYQVAGTVFFADHHRFDAGDVARIRAEMEKAGASAVVTTDKDAVRFEPLGALPFPLYRVPLVVRFEPDVVAASVDALLARAREAAGAAQ